MRKSETNKEARDGSKKKARKEIEKKLEAALESLIPVVGEKKFRKRIKKAGKIFSQHLNGAEAKSSLKDKKIKATADRSFEEV